MGQCVTVLAKTGRGGRDFDRQTAARVWGSMQSSHIGTWGPECGQSQCRHSRGALPRRRFGRRPLEKDQERLPEKNERR